MKDKFADLEEPKKRTLPAAIAVLVIFALLFTYRITHVKPIEISGVVQSISKDGIVKIRLNNGSVVDARTRASQALEIGAQVPVMETAGLLNAPTYEVANVSGQ